LKSEKNVEKKKNACDDKIKLTETFNQKKSPISKLGIFSIVFNANQGLK